VRGGSRASVDELDDWCKMESSGASKNFLKRIKKIVDLCGFYHEERSIRTTLLDKNLISLLSILF
jgi:hypothetical protein